MIKFFVVYMLFSGNSPTVRTDFLFNREYDVSGVWTIHVYFVITPNDSNLSVFSHLFSFQNVWKTYLGYFYFVFMLIFPVIHIPFKRFFFWTGMSDIWNLVTHVSFCKFWIYWVGENTKFTIWQLFVGGSPVVVNKLL